MAPPSRSNLEAASIRSLKKFLVWCHRSIRTTKAYVCYCDFRKRWGFFGGLQGMQDGRDLAFRGAILFHVGVTRLYTIVSLPVTLCPYTLKPNIFHPKP